MLSVDAVCFVDGAQITELLIELLRNLQGQVNRIFKDKVTLFTPVKMYHQHYGLVSKLIITLF